MLPPMPIPGTRRSAGEARPSDTKRETCGLENMVFFYGLSTRNGGFIWFYMEKSWEY